jgi:hypothetical protein
MCTSYFPNLEDYTKIYNLYFYSKNIVKIRDTSINYNIYDIEINNNNYMFINSNNNDFIDLCYNYEINNYNIIYINYPTSVGDDDKSHKFAKNISFYLNKNSYDQIKFDKQKILLTKLKNIDYTLTNLLIKKDDSEIIFRNKEDSYLNQDEKFKKAINKLSFKISECKIKDDYSSIGKIRKKLDDLKIESETGIKTFTESINGKGINYLFENYDILYNYLNTVKKFNLCITLLDLINKEKYDSICGQIKIYNEIFDVKENKFHYNFEALFELIMGSEIYKEQMERYIDIINNFNLFNRSKKYKISRKNIINTEGLIEYKQHGGLSYPLHHFMMAKGKSSVITPLLSLYFILIHKKKILIIVPDHLVPDTHNIINNYVSIFNIIKNNYIDDNQLSIDEYKDIFKKNNLIILSDTKIKELFLLQLFKYINSEEIIMLIDEFDYILDPIKSNFNITTIKKIDVFNEFNLLNPQGTIKHNIDFIKNGKLNNTDYYESKIESKELIKNDIKNIILQIDNGILKENIKIEDNDKKDIMPVVKTLKNKTL